MSRLDFDRLVDRACDTPVIDHNSTGGGDIREVPCGDCDGCLIADAAANYVDGIEAALADCREDLG